VLPSNRHTSCPHHSASAPSSRRIPAAVWYRHCSTPDLPERRSAPHRSCDRYSAVGTASSIPPPAGAANAGRSAAVCPSGYRHVAHSAPGYSQRPPDPASVPPVAGWRSGFNSFLQIGDPGDPRLGDLIGSISTDQILPRTSTAGPVRPPHLNLVLFVRCVCFRLPVKGRAAALPGWLVA
jgi:hypothetical protein